MTAALNRLALIALVTLGALGACQKKEEPAPKRPPPLTVAERSRATSACVDYVTRLCQCAQSRPDDAELAKRCELDKALPDAFKLTLSVDDDPTAPRADVLAAQIEARKIAKNCLESMNALAAQRCQ